MSTGVRIGTTADYPAVRDVMNGVDHARGSQGS